MFNSNYGLRGWIPEGRDSLIFDEEGPKGTREAMSIDAP